MLGFNDIMNKLSIIVLCFILVSCFSNSNYEKEELRLNLKLKNIEKIIFQCDGNSVELNSQETIMLVDKINSAKGKGMIKSAKNNKLSIFQINMNTVKIHASDNLFKWNGSGDYAFELDIDKDYFNDKCFELNLKEKADSIQALQIQNPIKTIKRIFNQYNEFEESTDSQDNLDSLEQSFKILENKSLNNDDLILLINVWMYYTVTDFDTRKYTENTLVKHKVRSVQAVHNRMINKMEWETNVSELNYLLEKLEAKQIHDNK